MMFLSQRNKCLFSSVMISLSFLAMKNINKVKKTLYCARSLWIHEPCIISSEKSPTSQNMLTAQDAV